MLQHMSRSRTVMLSREELLAKMRENRTQHLQIYAEALKGWQGELSAQLSVVRNAGEEITNDLLSSLDKLERIREKQPTSRVRAYDEAISLFEWETRPQIELSAEEFRCFVLDRWDWQSSFLGSTQGCSTSARAKLAAISDE